MVWRKLDADTFVCEATNIVEKVELSKLKENLNSLRAEFAQMPKLNQVTIDCLTAKSVEEFIQKAQKYSGFLNISSEIKRLEDLINLLEGL